MCLAKAGKVVAINDNIADIDYDGVIKTAGCELVSDLKVGVWVLVHAGFIIQLLDEDYAIELNRLNDEVKNA